MKKIALLACAALISVAAMAQTKAETTGMTASDYYREAEVHKQTALRLQEEQKYNSEVNSAPDGTQKTRATNKSSSRYYMIKQEWKKYEELMAQGHAIDAANKKTEVQKFQELKEILGIKDESDATIKVPQK